MAIKLPAYTEKEFKNAAKAAFPREEYAILMASLSPDGSLATVELYFPEDRSKFCSDTQVLPQDSWWSDAYKWAKKNNYVLIGDIHSHCYKNSYKIHPDTAPSEADFDSLGTEFKYVKGRPFVMAICTIHETKKSTLRAKIRAWEIQKDRKIKI